MILGIDPGPERTAYLHFRDGEPGGFGIVANAEMLRILDGYKGPVCIEIIASYGMAVGQSVFTTCRWIGRFQQAVAEPEAVHFLYRKQIVTHLCGSARAKDANVRRSLLDRFGGDAAAKKGGPLYGISKDVWSALAVCMTFFDLRKAGQI